MIQRPAQEWRLAAGLDARLRAERRLRGAGGPNRRDHATLDRSEAAICLRQQASCEAVFHRTRRYDKSLKTWVDEGYAWLIRFADVVLVLTTARWRRSLRAAA